MPLSVFRGSRCFGGAPRGERAKSSRGGPASTVWVARPSCLAGQHVGRRCDDHDAADPTIDDGETKEAPTAEGVSSSSSSSSSKDWADLAEAADWARFVAAMCALPEATEEATFYVARPAVERRIDAHVRRAAPVGYMCLVGPPGSGKTTVIRRALRGRPRVVYVEVDGTFPTINAALMHKITMGGRRGPPNFVVERMTNGAILRTLFEGHHHLGDKKKKKKKKKKEPGILVVEMESSAVDGETVKREAQALKGLCGTDRLAHGILVLNDDAHAAFKLHHDPGRQDFVWVGDFERDEALAFLDSRGALLVPTDGRNSKEDAIRRRLLDEVGANPQTLLVATELAREAGQAAVPPGGAEDDDSSEACSASASEARCAAERLAVEAFIERQSRWAEAEVANLLARSAYQATARRIARLLLTRKPGGVSEAEGAFVAADLAEAVRDHHRALCFDTEESLAHFASPAHENAARAWFAEKETMRDRIKRRWRGLGRFFVK